jgi:hypothetical protein
MNNYLNKFAVLLASIWVGGIWAIGYIATPVLFQSVSDKALAGMVAGKMFATMAYVGICCALYLLIFIGSKAGKGVLRQSVFWIVVLMLAITLLGQFGIQPLLAELKMLALPQYVMDSTYADRFKFWHGVSSITFLLQSLLGVAMLLKLLATKDVTK